MAADTHLETLGTVEALLAALPPEVAAAIRLGAPGAIAMRTVVVRGKHHDWHWDEMRAAVDVHVGGDVYEVGWMDSAACDAPDAALALGWNVHTVQGDLRIYAHRDYWPDAHPVPVRNNQ